MNQSLDAELQDILSNRAASYAFLALVYRQEPSVGLIETLVATAAQGEQTQAGQGTHTLNTYLRGLQGQDITAVARELGTEYAALFLNVGKQPVYPFESVYTSVEGLLMQEAYAEALQEYRQAGLTRARDFNEPEDHLALELEFMAHLGRQSLAAFQAGNPAASVAFLEKQNAFLLKHLCVWVPRFAQDVERATRADFYKGIAQVTAELVHAERETLPELIDQMRALA